MITVKFYGLLRLESGVKQLQIEADTVNVLLKLIPQQCPAIGAGDLRTCIAVVNGERAKGRRKLKDGDVVQFFSPAAGG